MISQFNIINLINYALFTVVLLELSLMGSGRLLEIGDSGITLRMVLFVVCMLVSIAYILTGKTISKFVFWYISIFITISLISILLGYLKLSSEDFIIEDIKPLSFFLMLIYFELAIDSRDKILYLSKLIKFSAVVISLCYIIVMYLIYMGVIDMSFLYDMTEGETDFIYRGDAAVFYKGLLYAAIGVFFFMGGSLSFSIIPMIIIASAILLSLSKGFILTLILVISAGLVMISKRKRLVFAILISIYALLLIFMPVFINIYTDMVGDKLESDMIRIITLKQVYADINIISILIGHGFGYGVPAKPMHMEVSMMEIFHKQGLMGIIFWISMISFIIYYYRQSCLNNQKQIALPFLLSSFFIYLVSLTNPTMNNPIGMSFLLISIISLRYLSRTDQVITGGCLSRYTSS